MPDENYFLRQKKNYKSSERMERQKERKCHLKCYLIGNCLLYIGPHCLRQHCVGPMLFFVTMLAKSMHPTKFNLFANTGVKERRKKGSSIINLRRVE